MRKTAILLAVGLLMTTGAFAQVTANDAGVPASSSIVLGPGGGFTEGGGGVMCPPPGVVSTGFSGATTQDGRINRNGIASACPTKAYPGGFAAGTIFNFETYTYANTDPVPACVTVNFDPDTVGATPCTTNAHMSAYMTSYDPLNQGTNFLGDVGSSVAQPFSFSVPGMTDLVLAVTNTGAGGAPPLQLCTFGFEVVDLPCVAALPQGPVAPEVPTASTLGLIALALLLAGGAFLVLRRRA